MPAKWQRYECALFCGWINQNMQSWCLNYHQSIYRFHSIGFVAIYFRVFPVFDALLPLSVPISFVLARVRAAFACKKSTSMNGNEMNDELIRNLCFSISMRSASACSASAFFLSCLLIFFLAIFVLYFRLLQIIGPYAEWTVLNCERCVYRTNNHLHSRFPWESRLTHFEIVQVQPLSRLCSIYLFREPFAVLFNFHRW